MQENQKKITYSKRYGKSIQYRMLENGDVSVYLFCVHQKKEHKICVGRKKRDGISEKVARLKFVSWEKSIKGSTAISPMLITFSELFEDFMIYARVHNRSYKQDESRFNAHLEHGIGKMNISGITGHTITKLQAELKDKKLASGTINHIVGVVHKVLRYGVENGLIEKHHLKKHEKLKQQKVEIRAVPDNILRSALENCKDEEVIRFIKLSVNLGARASTTLKIKKSDIFGEKIRLVNVKRGREYRIDLDEGSRGLVESCEGNLAFSYDYLKMYKKIIVLFKDFNEGKERHERVTPHKFRHTHAKNFLAEHKSLTLLCVRLDHSSVKVTEEFYQHWE